MSSQTRQSRLPRVSNEGKCTSEGWYGGQDSHAQELINNLPYIAMIVLGMVVLLLSINPAQRWAGWKWLAAVAYLIYGIAGAFWIILFLCPFCRYFDSSSCPCGYGRIAGKLRKRKTQNRESNQDCFDEKFKKHIPVIVPLWFIPVLVGVTVEFHTFSIGLLALLIVFAVDAFVLLPLFSTKHSCKECPQRDSCPWMKQRSVKRKVENVKLRNSKVFLF